MARFFTDQSCSVVTVQRVDKINNDMSRINCKGNPNEIERVFDLASALRLYNTEWFLDLMRNHCDH